LSPTLTNPPPRQGELDAALFVLTHALLLRDAVAPFAADAFVRHSTRLDWTSTIGQSTSNSNN
jgi:hypothetical protein